jgi:hypothetical protein
MENLFGKLKNDMKKGLEEGLAAIMKGANVVSVKMSELSEEGKRQYKLFNLHVKLRDELNALGDLAYDALKNMRSLDEDKKIRVSYLKIKKLEWQIGKIKHNQKIKKAASKKTAKKTASAASVKKPKKKTKKQAKA